MKKALIIAVIMVLAFVGLVQGLQWGAGRSDNGAESARQDDAIESEPEPELAARAAVMIDQETGDILYERQGHERMYPASTTKILTALLTMETCRRDEVVRVGSELNLVPLESSVAGLVMGQELTVEELLYALLLPSGNDAAYVLAVHIARQENPGLDLSDREAIRWFVDMMNDRAEEIGMKDSHFTNPDGYNHSSHYSTACDLALLAQKAMEYPLFQQIVATAVYEPGNSPDGQKLVWENTNELVVEGSPNYYSGATGIKTGHTEQAGYCLVAAAARGDRQVLSVVLNSSESRIFKDSINLLNYGFAYHKVRTAGLPTRFPYSKIAIFLLAYILLRFMIPLRRKMHRNRQVVKRRINK